MIRLKYLNENERKQLFEAIHNYTILQKTHGNERSYKIALRNEALFRTMYYCAFRVSEICNLEKTSLNIVNNKMEIFCVRLKGSKNNTLRIVDSNVQTSICEHLKFNCPNQYLFESKDGSILSRKTLDFWIKFYCKQANLKRDLAHCHTLRHTRAIELADMGCDLKELQFWLRHSNVQSTLIYFQFTTKQQEELYKKIKTYGRKESKNE